MKTKLTCLLLLIAQVTFGASWYVSSTVSSSGNGQSWATAWKNSSNIQWGSVSAGDIIYFDGGASGLSYGAFSTITASGTANNPITIARSTESGRDGIVTIATPFVISGSYIKFDGGGYKLVSGTTYRCGIVFTCSGNVFAGNIPSGAAVAVTGQRPTFRYCYFNGTYGAGSGHSLGVNNSTGFILDRSWFYQSNYEDQWVYAASSAGGSVAITNTVFQDNNKPNRTDTAHRDVANPWTGSGGWSMYLVGNIIFRTPGHASGSPQGDCFLMQVGYGGSTTPLTQVLAINNVVWNTARFIAFGSQNSGCNSFIAYNNTVREVINGNGIGTTSTSPAPSPTQANNIQNTTANPGFINATSPLGADGIPFTADDGFNITAGSSAVNAGSNVGVPVDILGLSRTNTPDLGAYEYAAGSGGGGGSPTPAISISTASLDYGWVKVGNMSNKVVTVQNVGQGNLLGAATTSAPWSVVNGAYDLDAGETHDVTVVYTPTLPGSQAANLSFSGAGTATATLAGVSYTNQSGLSWVARGGTIIAPMAVVSNYIVPTGDSSSSVPATGYALYGFSVTSNGLYYLKANTRATSGTSDSFYVAVDGVPVAQTNTWDVLPNTITFQDRFVGWRGSGTFDAPSYPTNLWYLTAGDHTLAIYRREANTAISNITVLAFITNSPSVPPFILSQPQDLRITNGQSGSFLVSAGGTAPLTYQWRRYGTNLSGQTSATLSIASAVATNAGPYTVVVANSSGSITSATATATIIAPPSIILSPMATNIYLGRTLTLTGAVDQATITSWKRSGVVIDVGTNSITLPVTLFDSGYYSLYGQNEVGFTETTPVKVFVFQSSNVMSATITVGTMTVGD